jgi:hypothetical protein
MATPAATGALALILQQYCLSLVNDLDLKLVAPEGTIFSPRLLALDAPAAPAKTGPDHIHTVEQKE